MNFGELIFYCLKKSIVSLIFYIAFIIFDKKQLDLIQFDSAKWVIDNFELVQDQIDYVNIIPKQMLDQVGLVTSICIAYNLPLKLITPDVYQPPIEFKRHIEVTIEGGSTWGPGGGPRIGDLSGTVTMSFP